jgi:tetrahydromethanopterin S-methyltransferase subunit B
MYPRHKAGDDILETAMTTLLDRIAQLETSMLADIDKSIRAMDAGYPPHQPWPQADRPRPHRRLPQ